MKSIFYLFNPLWQPERKYILKLTVFVVYLKGQSELPVVPQT